VKAGSAPTTTVADCVSEGVTTAETCTINNPAAGTYYALVYAYSAISGVSLTGTYTPGNMPALSVGDIVLTEGNAGTKLAVFPITLSPASASPVSFDVYTANGTAAAGSDYVANAVVGQVIAAGQTSGNFTVTLNGDTSIEGHETYTVNLTNPSGATIADGQGLGRINNDDVASLSIADVSVPEGNAGTTTATFVIRLSQPLPNPVTFDIATSNGTASSASDYVARSQSGRYLDAGRTTQVFEVSINGDTTSEVTEFFNVTISNVTGATLADGTAVGTIGNDEPTTLTSGPSAQTVFVRSPLVIDSTWQDADDRPSCATARERAQARRRGKALASCVDRSSR
jgi:hypothetical protein